MHSRVSHSEPVSQKMFFPERILPLNELCKLVTSYACSYEDIASQIEDRAYEECEQGKLDHALKELRKITGFFEKLKFKNEEISRDLADIYLLIG